MRKHGSLAMALLMALLLLAASAQATAPSKTTNDLARVTGLFVGSWDDEEWRDADDGPDEIVDTTPTTGTTPRTTSRTTGSRTTGGGTTITDAPVPLTGPFTLQIIANSVEVQNELNKIAAFLQERGLPVVDYFDFSAGNQNGELKNQIALLLPSGFDLNTLVMNEFVTAEPFFYSESTGNVLAKFDFPTEYRENQIIVAVVGAFDENGNVEWMPLKAETVKEADGGIRVQIHFTQDVLTKANDKPFALAVLSE